MEQRIPKRIFFCWFGGNQKPDKILRCIESWHKYLPDYEITEINESNFDINLCPYTKQAYEQKKWAFITDVCRLKALYDTGGLYFDADIEILKPLDGFLFHRCFTGHETSRLMLAAVMGAEQGHPWIKYLLDYYLTLDLQCIPNTQIVTDLSYPLVVREGNGFRYLRDGVVIYPVEVFAPYDHTNLRPTPTENSYAIHHFCGSWTPRGQL